MFYAPRRAWRFMNVRQGHLSVMITAFIAVAYLTMSNADELEELLSLHLATHKTYPPTTVSATPQIYASYSSNFTEVVKSELFVDKTMLIKDFLGQGFPPFLQISVGPHFGKSTNADMIKRFLEANVNENGDILTPEHYEYYVSKNYRTFAQKNLQIGKNKQIIEEYFGRYPVIFIDYKPLETVTKFDCLLETYREILLKTFFQHKYLLQRAEDFWNCEGRFKSDFEKYSIENVTISLSQREIEDGFTFLAEILYSYFKTHVVLIIDDYDMIVDAPVSEDCKDAVFNFVININNRIIESRFVNRTLLTGSLLRGGIPYSSKVASALDTFPQALKHYGLNKDEVHMLLSRLLRNSTEIKEGEINIMNNYSGYVRTFEAYDEMKVNPRDIAVCSVWSVIQYLSCVKRINIGVIEDL